jgi:hypothetical protein
MSKPVVIFPSNRTIDARNIAAMDLRVPAACNDSSHDTFEGLRRRALLFREAPRAAAAAARD